MVRDLVSARREITIMADDVGEPDEDGSWADRLWGPRPAGYVDLRPDPVAPEPPIEPAATDAEDVGASSGEEGIPPDLVARLARMEASLRAAVMESRAATAREVQEGLQALSAALDDRWATAAEALSGRHDNPPPPGAFAEDFRSLGDSLSERLDAVVRDDQERLHKQLAAIEDTVSAAAGAAADRISQEIAERLAADRAAADDPADRQEQLDGVIRHVAERITAELRDVRDTLHTAIVTSLTEAISEQARRWEAWRFEVDVAVAARFDGLAAGMGDLSRHLAALGGEYAAQRSELSHAISGAGDAQTAWFEASLGALAKAVADERRSSAALVRGALVATDNTLQEVCQVLGYLLERAAPEVGTEQPSPRGSSPPR